MVGADLDRAGAGCAGLPRAARMAPDQAGHRASVASLGRSGEKVATALEPVHEAYRPEPPVLLDPAGTTAPGLVGPGAARHGA
nr:hypothetical protein [Angustibacter aerolatus]